MEEKSDKSADEKQPQSGAWRNILAVIFFVTMIFGGIASTQLFAIIIGAYDPARDDGISPDSAARYVTFLWIAVPISAVASAISMWLYWRLDREN